MKAKDLVPYSVDEIVNAFETRPRGFIMDILHGTAHGPSIECIKFQLDDLLEAIQKEEGKTKEQVENELMTEIALEKYSSLLHQEFGLVYGVRSSSTVLNWIYVSEIMKELPPDKRKKVENREEEIRKEYLEEGKSHNEADSNAFSSKIFLLYQIDMGGGEPLRDVKNRPELMKRINNFYKKLVKCAEFQSSLDLEIYRSDAQHARVFMYYMFHYLFVSKKFGGEDFYENNLELKAIFDEHEEYLGIK